MRVVNKNYGIYEYTKTAESIQNLTRGCRAENAEMVELRPNDPVYAHSIPGFNEIVYDTSIGRYNTIYYNGNRAGIVGYIPSLDGGGYVQTLIDPMYRGHGLAARAKRLLAQKYGLKKLYATVRLTNWSSIRSLRKAGFHKLPQQEIAYLRSVGKLKNGYTRYYKSY